MNLRRTARFGFLAVPLTVLALSACGGGGTGTPALPTVSPTATPAPNPTASGDTFSYSGSLTQTFTLYATPAPSPSPSASPEPTSAPWVTTMTQSVTQNVSVATGQSFGGQTGLTEFSTKETDAGQLKTTSVASQTYLAYAQDASRASGVDVTEAGSSSTDSEGVSLQSVPGTGNGIVQELPSVPGAQWTNTAARTDTEKDPGGQSVSTTYAADGSYQQQLNYPEGSTASVYVYSDGSGVYQLPFSGVATKPSSVTVNAPSAGQIQLAYEIYPPGIPEAGAFTLNDWYPQATPVLAADTSVDEGATTVPSSCHAGASYQSAPAEKIVETKDRLDPIFGDYETEQITQYVSPSYGLVCAVVADDLKAYYDYSGQSAGAFTFSAEPLADTAVSETLALQSETQATASSQARRSAQAAPRIFARPSFARVRMILAAVHAKQARALYARLRSNSPTRQAQ